MSVYTFLNALEKCSCVICRSTVLALSSPGNVTINGQFNVVKLPVFLQCSICSITSSLVSLDISVSTSISPAKEELRSLTARRYTSSSISSPPSLGFPADAMTVALCFDSSDCSTSPNRSDIMPFESDLLV